MLKMEGEIMRILFITNIPSPYRIDFFNQLGQEHELKVIFEAKKNKNDTRNEDWYKKEIVNFKAVFLKEGSMEDRKINWKILKYLKRNNQDIIIMTNYAYFTELLAILFLKIKRIPYLLEVDGGIIKKEKTLKRFFKSFIIRNAKGYISPSKNTDEFLNYYGVSNDIIYRYPFSSLKKNEILKSPINYKEKKRIRKELNIKEKKLVLSVGRFIPIKGFDTLIKSSAFLSEDIAICIIGGQATAEYIELVSKHKLTNLYFFNFKNKDELKKYYKAADLFVLPTRGDIWGLVINEAMSFGLPVITTDRCVAGLELIENYKNGFIIPINDEKKLAQKINLIFLNENIRKTMEKENIKKINNYTIEEMVNKHSDILRSIKGE